MVSKRGFIKPHDQDVRTGAIKQFEQEWHLYTSPSAAAREIASQWGIGRTTLTEWLQCEEKWPRPTLSQVRRNRVLEKKVESLQARVHELEGQGRC